MRIHLTEDWYLTTVESGFAVSKLAVYTRKGKEQIQMLRPSYYSTLAGALDGLARKLLLDSKAESIEQLSADLAKINLTLQEIKSKLTF